MLGLRLIDKVPTGGPPRRPGERTSTPAGDKLLATSVLVVEDEAMIAWMIEDILVTAGFTAVRLASTGEEAEALAAADSPGLVISDINLGPGKDGIAAAVQIRGSTRLPMIFVTAYADDAVRRRLAEVVPGAQLLRKPVDQSALMRAVMRALGN